MSAAPDAIRPAATVILWRDSAQGPQVLMGQRGAGAAFMPSKFVFPGGAVDAGDTAPPSLLAPACLDRLEREVPQGAPPPLTIAGAALRELAEETGLTLGAAAGLPPPFRFVFRAITPRGRPRRFDARFLLAHSANVAGDADDFSRAEDELSHLQWLRMDQARALDLPFITDVVLAEVAAILRGADQPGVPFFDNSGPQPRFGRL